MRWKTTRTPPATSSRLDGDLREVAQGVDRRDGGPRRLVAVEVPFAEADGVADAAVIRSGRDVEVQADDLPPLAGLSRRGLGGRGRSQGDQRERRRGRREKQTPVDGSSEFAGSLRAALEPQELAQERKVHLAGRAVALLGDDQLGGGVLRLAVR